MSIGVHEGFFDRQPNGEDTLTGIVPLMEGISDFQLKSFDVQIVERKTRVLLEQSPVDLIVSVSSDHLTCDRKGLQTNRRPHPHHERCSAEAVDRFVGCLEDGKDLVEFGDREDFSDLSIDLTETQGPVLALDSVVDRDQRTKSGRRQMLDVAEPDDHLGSRLFINRGAQFIRDLLDIGFIENLAFDEFDLSDLADTRDSKLGRLGRHK